MTMRVWVGGIPLFLLAVIAWAQPADPDAVRKARALNRAGQAEAAEQVLRQAIRDGQATADLRAELGSLLVGRKRFMEAVEQFGLAAQQEPNNLEYSIGLAGALIADKRFGVAVEYLRAVNRQFDGEARYHHQLGLAYWGMHTYPDALREFQAAVRLDPALDVAAFFVGNCQAAVGDLPAAADAYRALIRRSPGVVSYHLALGKVLDQMGPDHSDEAIAALRAALRLDPADVPTKFALALALEKSGRLREAVPLMEAVSARYPDELPPHVALARLYVRLHEPEKLSRESATVRRLQRAEREKRSQPGSDSSLQRPAE